MEDLSLCNTLSNKSIFKKEREKESPSQKRGCGRSELSEITFYRVAGSGKEERKIRDAFQVSGVRYD